MVAIYVSEEAHKRILRRKQIMEEVAGRVVSASKALDVLLGVREYDELLADIKDALEERYR